MGRIVFVVLLFATTLVSAFAQEDVLRPNGRPGEAPTKKARRITSGPVWRLGLEAGVNINTSSRDVTGTSSTSIFNTFASGSGISPLFGIYLEAELSPKVAIGARVLYDMKSVSGSKSDVLRDCSIPDGYGGVSFVQAQIAAEYENSVSYITINPVVRVNVVQGLFVHAGPVLQFAASTLSNTLTQSVDPEEACRFIDSDGNYTLTSTSSTGEEDANPSSRFGLDFGAGYRIPITPKIELVPRLGYQFMFSEYAQGTSFEDNTQAVTNPPARQVTISTASLNSLQASISLWFTL